MKKIDMIMESKERKQLLFQSLYSFYELVVFIRESLHDYKNDIELLKTNLKIYVLLHWDNLERCDHQACVS